MYDFDQVHDRMGSDSIKWEKQLKFGQMSGLTPFWIADTDFATLPEAVQAIHNRADHSLFGYSFAAEHTYLSDSADYVMDYLEKNVPGIKAVKPQGTYLMWLDCSALGKSGTEVTAALVKNYGVAVGDGSVYGNAEHFIRFNIGCPRQTLEKGLEAMAKYVKSL